MNRVLILVISCEAPPYDTMLQTSRKTWDSIHVDGIETVFYCGESENKPKDNIIYLPIMDSLETMGHKTLLAFEWALKNKEFDYLARVNSSCYVNKKALIEYVQDLPTTNLFAGAEVQDEPRWMFGGCQFLYSKDVIQKIVDNKYYWNHGEMEDKAVSYLCDKLNIPFSSGKSCSINKKDNGWLCIAYGGENFEFENFSEIGKLKDQHFIRVKNDSDRSVDGMIMNKLFKYL